MSTTKLYTMGYTGWTPLQLNLLATEHDMTIVDVRISPRSRVAHWNQRPLQANLGERYLHCPEMGNVHYRGDGPIQLRDVHGGIAKLTPLMARGQKLVLMCMCKKHDECHRLLVATELAAGAAGRVGEIEIVHFVGPEVLETLRQATLFD